MELKFKYFAIDFDGTIAYDAYPNVGELIPGAKETMLKIKELGGEIAIWTCRTDQWAQDAKDFLDKNDIPYDYFNQPFDHHVNIYGGDNSRKIYADCYIDDRSVQFGCQPVDWEFVKDTIFKYEEWQIGDRVICIKPIDRNYEIGDIDYVYKYSINEDYVAIGGMGTNVETARKYFKKVN